MILMKQTIAVHIYGKVQNVGFRYYTRKTASALGITGYVKNLPDGSVYVEVTGEDNFTGIHFYRIISCVIICILLGSRSFV